MRARGYLLILLQSLLLVCVVDKLSVADVYGFCLPGDCGGKSSAPSSCYCDESLVCVDDPLLTNVTHKLMG